MYGHDCLQYCVVNGNLVGLPAYGYDGRLAKRRLCEG